MVERRARDLELLDALDAETGVAYEGHVWRIVRAERNVLEGFASKARWDPGTFDVLYTSLEPEGALEEIHFHFSRQPVFPSKIRSVLHRLAVKTKRTLQLSDMTALTKLAIVPDQYETLDYKRTQEIGDAAFFLGFDSIMAPSARSKCSNLILFMDRIELTDLKIIESDEVDWGAWQATRQKRRKDRS